MRDCRVQLRIYMPFACGMRDFGPFAHLSYIHTYFVCVCVFFPCFALLCYAMLCFVAILQAHGFCPSQKQSTCADTRAEFHLPWYGCEITVRITIKFAFITFKCSNKLFGRALVRLISVAPSAELRSMVLFFYSYRNFFRLFFSFSFAMLFLFFRLNKIMRYRAIVISLNFPSADYDCVFLLHFFSLLYFFLSSSSSLHSFVILHPV